MENNVENIDGGADELRRRLRAFGDNLWWSWDRRLEDILRRIDAELWERVEHNPTAFARDVAGHRLVAAATQMGGELAELQARLDSYMASQTTWAARNCRGLTASAVAYFSPEFCIHGSLPIYSGGLGVLAGDHMKSCSDLGVNVFGVSLLYRHGYFRQQIGADGWQTERYEPIDPERLPISRVAGRDQAPLQVAIACGAGTLTANVWQARIGRARLLLLDPLRWPEQVLPGALRLYGGDYTTRLTQEVVLGIGGYRALRALGIRPAVLHMNEGHSAFAAFEAIADRMEETGLGFEQAAADVSASVVFTTHTPVEAGHDRFPPGPLLEVLEPLRARLGLDPKRLLSFGRVDPSDDTEPFCMTVCALRLAKYTNAVSSLHGHVSRRMWKRLWPERREVDVPIGHVTNGVHAGTWLAPELGALYGKSLARDWSDCGQAARAQAELGAIDEGALWRVKRSLKQRLFALVRELAAARNERLAITEPVPELDPEALTIVVARRFALYKRALLPFRDLERLTALLTSERRPVQFLLAGKAHPADEPAKNVIRAFFDLARNPQLRHRVVFVEGYDQHLSRALLAGADLWLNIPRRPLEACGTSGMKAVLNATLNCSTLDGWWDEAFDPNVGFAIGDGGVHVDAALQDERDGAAVIDVLEREVVPLYYQRDGNGVARAWMERVKQALAALAYRYSADRMVIDYATRLYAPAAGRVSAEVRE